MKIELKFEPPVARITLTNPPQNVIDVPMMEELAAALGQSEARPEISTVLLSGSEKAFSAGVDVAAHKPEGVGEMLMKFHAVIRAVVASKKATVACVRGNCLGGGAELALVCDMVYTTTDAKWGFPEIKLGCFPPVAVVALAQIIGQKRAAELILSGAIISGRDAAAMGLATACGSQDELKKKTEEVLNNLAQLSPSSLAITKKALYGWDAMHFEKGLARAEQIYLDELMQSHDAKEGIAAWMEKRQPRWEPK
jgi:cyclohexa-1,5-dienecarbonyl-CoA hydratase